MANLPTIDKLSLGKLYFTDGEGNYRLQWSTSAIFTSSGYKDDSGKAAKFVCRVYDRYTGDLVEEIETTDLSVEIALDGGYYLWNVTALDEKGNVIAESESSEFSTWYSDWDQEGIVMWKKSSASHILSRLEKWSESELQITNEKDKTISNVFMEDYLKFNLSGNVLTVYSKHDKTGGVYIYENGQWNYKFFTQQKIWGSEAFDDGDLIFCDTDDSSLNKTIYRWNNSTAFSEYRKASSQIYRMCEKYYITQSGVFSNETGKQVLKYNVAYGEVFVYNDFFFNIYIKDKSGKACDSIDEDEEGTVIFKYAFIDQNGKVGKQGEIVLYKGSPEYGEMSSEEMYQERIGNCICISPMYSTEDTYGLDRSFALILNKDGSIEVRESYGYSFSLDQETGALVSDGDVIYENVDFSPVYPDSSIPDEPDTPENLDIAVNKYNAAVTWGKVTAPKGVKVTYEISIDEGEPVPTTSNKYTLKNADVGEHTFKVRTVFSDKTGSEYSDWSSVETAEVKDITAPKTGNLTKVEQTGDDTVLVEWTEATDNVGIDRYVVTCGNKDIEEIEVYPDEDLSYEFSGVSGKVTVTLTPYDEAGNPGKTVKKTITMKDVTPPDQVTGLDDEGVNSKSGGTLVWDESDDNEGVTQYLITVEDAKGKKTSYTSKTNLLKLKKLNAGNYKFTVIAVDKAKNQSIVSEECPFEVKDGIEPKIKKLSAKVNKDNSATVTWNATDETAFSRVEYTLSLDDDEIDMDTVYDSAGTLKFEDLSAGSYTLRMTAYDTEDNESLEKKVSFKIKGLIASPK